MQLSLPPRITKSLCFPRPHLPIPHRVLKSFRAEVARMLILEFRHRCPTLNDEKARAVVTRVTRSLIPLPTVRPTRQMEKEIRRRLFDSFLPMRLKLLPDILALKQESRIIR